MNNIKYIKRIIVSLIVALIIEIFIFNYPFIRTIKNNPSFAFNHNIFFSGIVYEHDNIYRAQAGEKSLIFIDASEIDINELFIDISDVNGDAININILASEIGIVDGNTVSSYSEIAGYNQTIVQDVIKSKFITITDAQNYSYIVIEILGDKDILFELNNIIVNPIVVFDFCFVRFLSIAFIMGIILIYLIEERFWATKYVEASFSQKILLYLSIVVSMVISCVLLLPPEKNAEIYKDNTSYMDLAGALLDGKTYLEEEPPQYFEFIDNPYNTLQRGLYVEENIHDVVYYNGHYYVYFGILPCLLFYIPSYIITGNFMSINAIIFICNMLFLVGVAWLLKTIVSIQFPETSIGIFTVLYNLLIYGSYMFFAVGHYDQYLIPTILAIVLTIYGVNFWFLSVREDEINKKELFIGSLCMALVAACRPNMIIYSFCALIVFGPYLKVNKIGYTKSKRNMNLLVGITPYILVAIPLMLYNYIRFGSPVEFGADFQLTAFDMTARKFDLIKIFKGILSYLFAWPKGSITFPFIAFDDVSPNNYYDLFYVEKTVGGIFVLNPILILLPLIFIFIKNDKLKKRMMIPVFCSMASIFVIIFDIEYVGVVSRYYLDFALFLFVSVVYSALAINEIWNDVVMNGLLNGDKRNIGYLRNALILMFCFLSFITIFNGVMLAFAPGYKSGIDIYNSKLFYGILYALKLW